MLSQIKHVSNQDITRIRVMWTFVESDWNVKIIHIFADLVIYSLNLFAALTWFECIQRRKLHLSSQNVVLFFRWGTRYALRPPGPRPPNCCSWLRGCCSDRSSRTGLWPSTRWWSWTRSTRDTSTVTSFSGSCAPWWRNARTCVSSSCPPPSTSNFSLTISAVLLCCRYRAGCFPYRWAADVNIHLTALFFIMHPQRRQ